VPIWRVEVPGRRSRRTVTAFAKALEASGATSLETEFIEAGTKPDVLKVESYVDA
jgi:hypothetical protein